ncbi:MAG: protein kinase [Eubacteriales bacterium]|nr:protein kinase [Eubacteriales bacterium]
MTEHVLAGRYRIKEKIGEGGMAIVYRAKDSRTGHDVAVKFLKPEFHDNPEFIESFKREAKAASRMSHHNIVNLLDVGEDEKNLYIVIEYVHGKTLKDIIKDRGKLNEDLASQIITRILAALQHAHEASIIHRDIKPHNVLVDQNGYIKVSDFGIAKMVGSNTEMGTQKAESVMGSVHYFSPEQAKGESATFASDIYSVGVVYYELLTGHVPFEGDTPVAVAMKQINELPKPVRDSAPEVSLAIESVVMKALSKDPKDRYDSALAMAQAIKRALKFPEKEVTRDTPVFKTEIKRPKIKRRFKLGRKFGVISLSVAVLFTIVLGSIIIYNRITNRTTVPYLVGETEEEAVRIAINAWLKPEIVRQSSSQAAGTVILQSHDFGYPMSKNDTILLTISTGPMEKPVPSLLGLDETEGTARLSTLGLNMLVTERVMDASPSGTILSQMPKAGSTLSSGGVVQVSVSGGQLTLPDVEGLSKDSAVQKLQNAGLPLTRIKIAEVAVEDSSRFGKIADQLPKGGTVVMPSDNSLEIVLAIYVEKTPNAQDTNP